MVKPGIKKLGIKRSKEINLEKREALNLLTLRQCYLTRKIQQGRADLLPDLKTIHLQIDQWYTLLIHAGTAAQAVDIKEWGTLTRCHSN